MLEIQRYRRALDAKVLELSQTVRNRHLIAIEHTPEDCERIVLAAQRAMEVTAIDQRSLTLRAVKAALGRLQSGVFGVCSSCNEEISAQRLNAIPWAEHCVFCQDRIDRETPAA